MKDIVSSEKNKKIDNKRLERAKKLYEDYISLGTLKKVSAKHGISRERVRQILKKGDSIGLFKYPPEEPDLPASITPEQLRKDFLKYGSVMGIANHYGVYLDKVSQQMERYNLSSKELHFEVRQNKALEDYKSMVEKFGHHPTTTEMAQNRKWSSLHNRIVSYYKSMDNFRKTYDYPIPKKGNPKFTEKIKRLSRANRKNILKCLKIKPGITMSEIVDTLGIAKESIRLHLLKLKDEGIVGYTKKGYRHYYFLENPEKLTEKERHLKLQDIKPAINPEDKAFIGELSHLYLRHGDITIVSKKMKEDKAKLLERIDCVLKAGYLYPIKNRRALILSLRIKKSYDKLRSVYQTSKKYRMSRQAIGKYLRYGNKAGLFKYPDSSKKRKYKIRHRTKKEDACSKKNIETMLKIKKESDRLGSIKNVAQIRGISHEKIRQILTMGNDLGLYEFPPRRTRLYSRITKSKLRDAFIKCKSMSTLSKRYKVSLAQVKEAIEKHGISIPALMGEISRDEALKSYQDLTKELGHHPSTTEIRERHGYLLLRIKQIWGSIYNFRKSYGFPSPKIGRPLRK